MGNLKSWAAVFLLVLSTAACIKPYEPEVIAAANAFLVVDGIINCAPEGETNITLSRTRKLSDTVANIPERFAQVTIEAENGARYQLQEDSNGYYRSVPLNLDPATRYRLRISTLEGSAYESDFAPVALTPPIDSVNFSQEEADVTMLVSTHDPQNKTRYYRWEYDETWEYHASIESNLKWDGSQVLFREPEELTYICWKSQRSTDVLQYATVALSEDIVQKFPVAVLPAQSRKFSYRYSINVKQFALTKESYEYWQIVKRNTQNLGSIFDVQPSQLVGNIHNLTKPGETVIGFVTATTVQEKRIFIWQSEISNSISTNRNCAAKVVATRFVAESLANPAFAPAYYVGGPDFIAVSSTFCVDCRLEGGTTVKPSFWQ